MHKVLTMRGYKVDFSVSVLAALFQFSKDNDFVNRLSGYTCKIILKKFSSDILRLMTCKCTDVIITVRQ